MGNVYRLVKTFKLRPYQVIELFVALLDNCKEDCDTEILDDDPLVVGARAQEGPAQRPGPA